MGSRLYRLRLSASQIVEKSCYCRFASAEYGCFAHVSVGEPRSIHLLFYPKLPRRALGPNNSLRLRYTHNPYYDYAQTPMRGPKPQASGNPPTSIHVGNHEAQSLAQITLTASSLAGRFGAGSANQWQTEFVNRAATKFYSSIYIKDSIEEGIASQVEGASWSAPHRSKSQAASV
jgi:hypothetical protein